MSYLLALVIGLSSISAPVGAELPTYLTEVSTTQAPTTEDPQVDPVPTKAPEVGVAPTPTNEVRCEEDMPCWEGSANDSRTNGDYAQDAWDSFDILVGSSARVDNELALSYVKSATEDPTPTLSDTEFAVPSASQDGIWHIFRYLTVVHA